MASLDQNSNATLQGIARHINCLTEDNRNTRKRALEGIRKDTLDRNPSLQVSELTHILSEIIKPLLKAFSDPVEKCRSLAISTVKDYCKVIEKPVRFLPYIMPVLVQRLGQQDITESSEELRLLLVEFCLDIVEFSGKDIHIFLDDFIKILQRTLIDAYPEVKKESCRCSSAIAKSVPEYFHMQSETLIKPLLMSITHQHSKVRTLVIQTIGDVIQYGNGKAVDTIVSHFAQRLFDDSPAVRKAVVMVTGHWLLDLPDRYSFHHKLMPLLLTGISDTQPEIQEVADSLWYDVGLKFEKENEKDFKDKLDFEKEAPSHYPPNVERPNLGCRVLVNRNLSKIVNGLMRDIVDWVAPTRLKSASLLYVLLLNAEDYITQHMTPLISGMNKACADQEVQVVKDVQRSAELVGYFVEPEVWWKLVQGNIKSTQSYTSLMILANIMKGTERSKLKPYLSDICCTLANPDICLTITTPLQQQLLKCMGTMMAVGQTDVRDVSQIIFNVLITVIALKQADSTAEEAHTLLDKLSEVEGFSTKDELFRKHTKPLINSFEDSYVMWNTHTPERLVLDTLLIESGPIVGELLDEVMAILVPCLDPKKDAEMRVKFFSLLSQLLMNAKETLDSQGKFGDISVIVVRDIVIPNMVWQAGRIASAIRTSAVSCMWALLQSGVLDKEKMQPVVEDLITQLKTSMDSDNKNTRLVSCRVMTRLLELMNNSLDQDNLYNFYPELLKRLDDSSDEIRIVVSKTFLAYLECFEGKYKVDLYRLHLESIYKGLLVHLDDPDAKIQNAIQEVLKEAGKFSPQMLITEIEGVKHKHRTNRYCEELIKTFKSS
ncbi:dynein axonemal assembly factor 5-like [Mytilus trossulus]|uniref:dynein axonemal assembly factor 5-like n=1 Tax=Mytilus trossulus TaxID=6551 RepID=UPI003003D50F